MSPANPGCPQIPVTQLQERARSTHKTQAQLTIQKYSNTQHAVVRRETSLYLSVLQRCTRSLPSDLRPAVGAAWQSIRPWSRLGPLFLGSGEAGLWTHTMRLPAVDLTLLFIIHTLSSYRHVPLLICLCALYRSSVSFCPRWFSSFHVFGTSWFPVARGPLPAFPLLDADPVSLRVSQCLSVSLFLHAGSHFRQGAQLSWLAQLLPSVLKKPKKQT